HTFTSSSKTPRHQSQPFCPYTALFRSVVGSDVFTQPLSAAEVGADPSRLGKGARLNVEGAIQAALDAREGRTRPITDPVTVVIGDRKSTRLNSSHVKISYAVFSLINKQ